MNTGCRPSPITALTLLSVLLVATPGWASTRLWQPLLLRGKQLAPLLNVPVSRIEVLAVHRGKLEPIPFQVDAMLTGGMYDLPQGPVPTTATMEQAVGPRDEMSMMMFDLGERISNPGALPPKAVEVTVTDPLGGPARYAYIASVSHPRLSATRYVDYDPQKEIVETDHYRLGFKDQFPGDFRVQNRRGELTGNLIDGFELRGSITVLNLFKVKLTETDVKSQLLAYKTGPVRIIRRVGHRIQVFRAIQSPQVSTVEFFYRDFGQAPFTMRLPLRRLYRDVRGRIAMDFVDLRGYSLITSNLDKPVEIGSRSAAALDAHTPAQWLALRGNGRLMLQAFAPSPDLDKIDRVLYYQADPCPSGRTQCAAIAAAIGIDTDGWQRLSSGPHRFDPLLISVPEDYGAHTAIEEASVAPLVSERRIEEKAGPASPALTSPAPLTEPGK